MVRSGEGWRRRLSRPIPQWLTIAVLAFAGLCSAFMFTLVVPLQAELPALLETTRENTSWVITITLLVSAVATPISGRLGDMFGKRRVIVILLGILVAGSLVAAFSTSIVGIIIGRGLQGFAMGVVPLGIAIIRDVVSAKFLGTAVALVSATIGIGGAIGMPLGAFVAQYADFHALFWLAAGLGATGIVLVLLAVPGDVLRFPGRVDIIGALGLALGMVGLLLMLSRGAEWGWTSIPTLASGIGGAVVLLLWGWYQLRAKDPLLDLRVAARPAVLFTNLASLGTGFALFSSQVTFPQMLELPVETGSGFGLDIVGASFVVMVSGVVMMLVSPLSGWLERTVGARRLFTIGTVAVVFAYAFVLMWSTEVWQMLIANVLIGIGIGFSFAAMPIIIMRAVPASETGASNGLNTLFRTVGTSTASAVMGGVLAAMSVEVDGVTIPTRQAFELCFWLALIVAIAAFVFSLLVPRQLKSDPHPSLPS